MPIRVEGEAICCRCGAKAPCAVDLDVIMHRSVSGPGGAVFGLPDWFHKEGPGNLAGENNLACSEKCMKILAEDARHRGEWKHCR